MIRGNVLWFLLLGSLMTLHECQSRAVNISNTWTLPQEGFSVFYRFFRDKISWFEADAVCQFHHANLVTVDNGVQFDAARAFLKELDVTDFVWIGLMRPQNTQHFGWTNSKPLDSTSGYWADPFPAMESPLCAVIDPARDFRWHALRCGGPETAAFLCEMEVPQWASECTVQAMPSLTVQYMSDSGTVELSRDCGEEGTRHISCHGKEDRNTILNELTCIDDTDSTDNTLKTSSDLLVDIHQKSVELIKSVSSDNKEDNNIDEVIDDEPKLSGTGTFKLNVDDVMMGDQPLPLTDDKDDLQVMSKIEKKPKKKADVEEKYLKKGNKKKLEKVESEEELMMGDQAVNEETVSHSTVDSKPKEIATSAPTPVSTTLSDITETTISSTTIPSTTETRLRRETEISVNEAQTTGSSIFATEPSIPATTNNQPFKTSKIESTPKPLVLEEHLTTPHHQKESQDVHLASDHFIPPMLLVRTQFSLSNGHNEHVEGPRKHIEDHETSTASATDATTKLITSPLVHSTTTEVTTTTVIPITERPILDVKTTQTLTSEASIQSIEISTTKPDPSTPESSSITNQIDESKKLLTSPVPTTNEQINNLKKTTETNQVPTEAPRFRQPHAPKHSSEFHPKTAMPPTQSTPLTSYATTQDSTTIAPKETTENIVTDDSETVTTVSATTSPPMHEIVTEMNVRNNCSVNFDASSEKPTELSKKEHSTTVKHHLVGNVIHSDHSLNDHLAEINESDDPCWTEENSSADLSNSDIFQPYRPNRRRVLTKPESHSYIKKVLG